jgi:ankyrin repeat protein
MDKMNKTEKQIFCADANLCAILAKRNSQNKWELWGLSEVTKTGDAKYETHLFADYEFDDVEPMNTTSGHSHICVLNGDTWSEIGLIEHKKAENKTIEIGWEWSGNFPRSLLSNAIPYAKLSFTHEDENESIESLVARGAQKNPTILIDQLEAAECHTSEKKAERLIVVIDYFLKNGTDVNAKNEWGNTALMAAAYHDCADITEKLLQNGAKVNEKNNFGDMAISAACNQLNVEVIELLLQNGAEVDADCFLYFFNIDGASADEMKIQLKLSKLLLNKGIDINSKDSDGKTALMLIAGTVDIDSFDIKEYLEKQKELMQFILDNGVAINAQDNEGKTALMHTIISKNQHIAEYLLERGADANVKDNAGNTALTYAQINSVRIIGKLRKKMNAKQAYQINNNAIPNQGKTLNLYQFTYSILPYLTNEVFTGNLSYDALSDKDWIQRIVEKNYDISFDWADFEVNNIQKNIFQRKAVCFDDFIYFSRTERTAFGKICFTDNRH